MKRSPINGSISISATSTAMNASTIIAEADFPEKNTEGSILARLVVGLEAIELPELKEVLYIKVSPSGIKKKSFRDALMRRLRHMTFLESAKIIDGFESSNW